MDIQFAYQKKRNSFGRPYQFFDNETELISDYPSNPNLREEFILRNPVSQGTQYAPIKASHDLNTTHKEYKNCGMNHIEGGWPKDISFTDEEAIKRYRKKIEKEENFADSLLYLLNHAEEYILENNSVDIYEEYFMEFKDTVASEKSSARTMNFFQNPNTGKYPVSHTSFDADGGKHIAVTYCTKKYPFNSSQTVNSYIWGIDNPSEPILTLKSNSPACCMEYHQKDSHILCGGYLNGTVGVIDTRKAKPMGIYSRYEESHKDPTLNVLWINSKSGSEFFSTSLDGQCKWWDTRKLNDPLETLLIAPGKNGYPTGITCMEYDSSIPTRFMLGTEEGLAILCNRKGKTPVEKILTKYSAHYGPVKRIQRNPAFSKNFLTVGDWSAKLFAEECKESPIIWTNYHRATLTDGTWSPTRCSVFFTTRSDGVLDIWDITAEQNNPSLSIKVCDFALTTIKIHENARILCLGNGDGGVHLVELSENFNSFTKADKALLTAMLERETRREKILEARNKEIRLKMKTKITYDALDKDAMEMQGQDVTVAEKEFYELVAAEKEKFAYNADLEEENE